MCKKNVKPYEIAATLKGLKSSSIFSSNYAASSVYLTSLFISPRICCKRAKICIIAVS